jgi:hypothetical protein
MGALVVEQATHHQLLGDTFHLLLRNTLHLLASLLHCSALMNLRPTLIFILPWLFWAAMLLFIFKLQNAPIVDPKKTGQKIAPAFCPGTATCFMSVIGDKRGFTHTQPDVAKVTASRITGTV